VVNIESAPTQADLVAQLAALKAATKEPGDTPDADTRRKPKRQALSAGRADKTAIRHEQPYRGTAATPLATAILNRGRGQGALPSRLQYVLRVHRIFTTRGGKR
jgi:hypothetical protein